VELEHSCGATCTTNRCTGNASKYLQECPAAAAGHVNGGEVYCKVGGVELEHSCRPGCTACRCLDYILGMSGTSCVLAGMPCSNSTGRLVVLSSSAVARQAAQHTGEKEVPASGCVLAGKLQGAQTTE
jgi:hypothetical protein